MQLIVGLGNPGPRYTETRHNAGFWFLERFADRHRVQMKGEPKFQGTAGRLQGGGVDCWLFKPGTFMNDSGGPVQAFLHYYGIAPGSMLVVHDEVDFPAGVVRLKVGGGHGGHNGVRDLIERLGGGEFQRLRIGVGHPGFKDAVVGHVLDRPAAADRQRMDEAIGRALEVMPLLLAGEMEKAMTALHTAEQEKGEREKGKEESED